jgi:hypothetical protein
MQQWQREEAQSYTLLAQEEREWDWRKDALKHAQQQFLETMYRTKVRSSTPGGVGMVEIQPPLNAAP